MAGSDFLLGGSFSDTSNFDLPSYGMLDAMGGTDPSAGNAGLGGLALGLNVLGTGLKAYGQYEQGQEIAGAYEFNAALTLQGLDYDIGRIDVAEGEYGGTQKAMYAKAGVTMSGSPLDVMLKTATNFELDKQVANYNAQSKVAMDNYKASQAKKQAEFDSVGTLISGAAGIAQTVGMFAMLA